MVEMLGVLAVMGVLSIGAIVGIRSALDTHKANSIINEVNRRAVVWTANKSFGQSFDSFASDSLGYTWANPQDKDSYIELTITGIEPNVCTKIHRDDWSLVHVNKDCSLFQFKSDASVGTETATCGPCATPNPVSGACDDNDDLCPSGQNCQNGFCSSCDHGQWKNNKNQCLPCDNNSSSSNSIASQNECSRCYGTRFYTQDTGKCWICTRGNNLKTASREECLQCPNRVYSPYAWYSNDNCQFCDSTYGIQNEDRSDCLPNPDMPCPDGQYFANGGCVDCGTGAHHSTRSECLKCLGSNFIISSYSNRCQNATDTRNWTGAYYNDCISAPHRYFIGSSEPGICAYCPGEVVDNTCSGCPDKNGLTYIFVPHLGNQQTNRCCPDGFDCSSTSSCPIGTTADGVYCVPNT